eukprot:TRINITY_DN3272_c0_g1_i2.p1 TRINITY_DN3272_c0_g1~~TRINITY_DN3272_c0_g1_i2.p1  ORF type:complete len:225 (-),score=48.79 TRINITY_DN3272_c0_g1_i2:258-932(-)
MIIVGVHEDINQKVDQHISKGCPKEESFKSKTHPCSYARCKNAELVPIICPGCRVNFCVAHRHQQDHNCPGLQKDDGSKTSNQYKKPKGFFADLKEKAQLRLDDLMRKQAQVNPTAKKVMLMKIKTKAQGNANIPTEKRYYLEVIYPLDTNIAPKQMFFNSSWTIGKVLDVVADAGKIENNNNKANATKLGLFCLKNGLQLENSITLGDYDSLQSGDSILLENV